MQPPIASVAKSNSPSRLLFIASIGNQAPYRRTRHSAGHLLLDELAPRLRASWAQNRTGDVGVGVSGAESAESTPTPTPSLPIGAYYTTWYSPSYMNESGPKLVRQMSKWLSRQDEVVSRGTAAPPKAESWLEGLIPQSALKNKDANGNGLPATLVILHDELEMPLGKIRVRRGGPEAASLRGHRGLISVLESLRGKGLYAHGSKVSSSPGQKGGKGKEAVVPRDLSILRVGIGIGRPDSRAKNAVADYVLTEMNPAEVDAVHEAAGPVMGILEEELYWNGQEVPKKK